jgi:hypothetical protein
MDDQPAFRIRPQYDANDNLQFAAVSDDFAVPRRFFAENETVSLLIEIADDGQPRCRSVEIRGEQLSSDDLRLPLARLVRHATASAIVGVTPGADGNISGAALVTGLLRRGNRERDFYQQYTSDTDRPRRGQPVPDERLQRVAGLYREALDRGDPPTQTVADVMHASRPTAARWVAAARDRGLLGAAVRGRAGES